MGDFLYRGDREGFCHHHRVLTRIGPGHFDRAFLNSLSYLIGPSGFDRQVLEAFVIGAIARGIATIIVFPYSRAKVRLNPKPQTLNPKP